MALAGAEKSKTLFFFVVSQMLMLLALYSLYDEAVVRRPWKQFIAEFDRLEMQVAQKEYDALYDKFVSGGAKANLDKLKLELEQAVTAKESDEYLELQKKFKALKIANDDMVMGVKFDKSVLDALYYQWKHAFQTGHHFEELEKEYKALEASIAKQNEQIKQSDQDLADLQGKMAVFDDKITSLEEKILEINKPLADAQAKINNIAYRPSDIKQVVVNNLGVQGNIYWNKVDRCETCHVGVNKSGLEDVTKAFGLKVVKDNKALQEEMAKDPKLRGWLITEKQKTHYQIMYGTHPKKDVLLATHAVEKFGCTGCHGGEGRALQIKDMKFVNNDDSHGKESSGHEHMDSTSGTITGVFGHKDQAHATQHHGIEALLRGEQSQSNCLSCHKGQLYIPEADKLTKGLSLFADLGCHGCHLVEGYEQMYKVGPELNKVASKVDKTWLVDWLKNPKNYMPNSRMPMFALSDDEAVAVASYLMANSKPHNINIQSVISGDAANGKKLFDNIGCRGCHSADSDEKTYAVRSKAPNLSRLSAKVTSSSWVYDWIMNPKNYSQHARMPSLRLTSSEASDITSYLLSLNVGYKEQIKSRSSKLAELINPSDSKQVEFGKKIMTDRGCYSCHNIDGFDGMDRIGPQLTAEALKETIEFDFGDSLKKNFEFKDEFGQTVYVGHEHERPGEKTDSILARVQAPKNVSQITNMEETWQAWVRNKLRYPLTIYSHTRAQLKMPSFALSNEELDSLVAFLKALNNKQVPPDFNASAKASAQDVIKGQRIVAQYNCQGCHSIWGYGGDINAVIDKNKGAKLTQYYPPSLEHVGSKIRPEWLVEFLKKPTAYRPMLETRMPSFNFSTDELNTLVRYFAGMSKVNYGLTDTNYAFTAPHIEAAKALAAPDAYNCFSCHLINGKTPGPNPDTWAPDWAKMGDRLQYDFIAKWIKSPSKYQKFAVMPGFLNSDAEAHPDFLGGKAEEQLQALRDYVLSISKAKPYSSPVARPAATPVATPVATDAVQ